jgi:hypothetical protein
MIRQPAHPDSAGAGPSQESALRAGRWKTRRNSRFEYYNGKLVQPKWHCELEYILSG